MADETAFFRFGNNAQQTAAEIATAMRQIQESLQPHRVGTNTFEQEFGRDLAGLGQLFSRANAQVEKGVAELNAMLGNVGRGAGQIRPENFQAEYQKLVSRYVGDIPKTLAEQLALAPEATALRAPAAQMAQVMAQDFFREFDKALSTGRRGVPALSGIRIAQKGAFVGDLQDILANPVGYGEERSALTNLTNRVRAERFLRNDPTDEYGDLTPDSIRPLVQQMREEARDAGRINIGEKGGVSYTPSGALQELQEEIARRREAIAVAGQQEKADKAAEEQLLQLAAAERAVNEAFEQRGRLLIDPRTNQPFKRTASGIDATNHPLDIAAAERYRQQAENTNLLASRSNEVDDVASHQVLDGKVYKDRGALGHEQITNEYTIKRVLEAQTAEMERQVLKAQRLNELDGKRVARGEANNSGVLGGFLNRFHRGEQSIGTGFGGQLASATAFSLAYGSLFALQGAARDTLNEFKDYQDSMTDLEVAARDSGAATSAFVNDLDELARMSGSNVGASIDTAARAIRAFGDPLGDSTEKLQSIGLAANDAATKLALIANKSLPDATGDVISVGTAFGLEPDQLNQVVDAIANAKRTLGGDPTQIAQGLSLIAGAGQEAGYSLDQLAAVMSLVQARTDQSGQAIATRLGRIFQIIQGSTGKSLSRELNVDPTQSVKDQLEAYAKIYSNPNTSSAVRDRISSALGGTANLREILPLLKENTRLQQAYKEALNNAGQGSDEFARKSNNLVGTLKQIQGTVSSLQVQLGRSGIFAPVAAGIKVLEPALHAVDRLLKLYNEMPGPLRVTASVLADILLLSKAIGVIQAKNAGLAAVSGGTAAVSSVLTASTFGAGGLTTAVSVAARERVVAEETMNASILGAARARLAAEAAGGGTKGGLATLGGGLLSKGGLISIAAIAGLVGFDYLSKGVDQAQGFQKTSADTSNAYDRIDGSAASLRAAAHDLSSAAGNIRKSPSTFSVEGVQTDLADSLDRQSAALADQAKRVAAEERRTSGNASVGAFGSGAITTVDQLGDGLSNLAQSGQGAVTQMRLLYKALNQVTTQDVVRRFQPETFTASLEGAIKGSLKAAFSGGSFKKAFTTGDFSTVLGGDILKQSNVVPFNPSGPPTGQAGPFSASLGGYVGGTPKGTDIKISPDDAYNLVSSAIDFDQLRKSVIDGAKQKGIKPGQPIKTTDVRKIVEAAINEQSGAFAGLGESAAGAQAYLIELVMKAMLKELAPTKRQRLLNGNGQLSADQVMSIINPSESGKYAGLEAIDNAALAGISPKDDGTQKIAVLKAQLNQRQRLVRRSSNAGEIEALTLLVDKKQDELAGAQIDRLERLRKAAQNKPGLSRLQVRNVGRNFLRREINAAGDNTAKLIQIMENADRASLAIVEAHLREAAKIANAAARARAALAAQAQAQGLVAGGHPVDDLGNRTPLITEPHPIDTQAQQQLDAFHAAQQQANIPKKDSVFSTGSDSADHTPPKDPKTADQKKKDRQAAAEKAQQKRQDAADLAAAKAEAHAADIGGGRAEAVAQLRAARANLAAQKKGSTEYYQALAQLYQAQDALASANADLASSKAQARAARLGGGIASARADLVAARSQMRLYAKGTAEWYQALGSFFEAQRAMRDAVVQYRITKFKLHGDITNPVENARDELRGAIAQLHADRGSGADVRAEDRLAVREGRQSLLAEKFQQRLSDAQTAEQLGRISFQAYVRYLENEHNRLDKIKHRTRQQQDQLNTIDLALKEAAGQADSQFNLGDININGLVYAARRYATARLQDIDKAYTGAGVGNVPRTPAGSVQHITVAINGADVGKVRQVLKEILGSDNPTRTLRNRKV